MSAALERRLNGDDDLKTLKWISIGVVLALLLAMAVNGSLANTDADNAHLSITQTRLERGVSGLNLVGDFQTLLPAAGATLEKKTVELDETLTLSNASGNEVVVNVSAQEALYTDKNAVDHIVVVTNTGNIDGYVRIWFAFEMGELTETEFQNAVVLNQNTTQWTWGEFRYGVQIDGKNYAVICAEYNAALAAGQTTAPSLLQILMPSDVSNQTVQSIDGNDDGLYTVIVRSQVISDSAAWSQMNCPW